MSDKTQPSGGEPEEDTKAGEGAEPQDTTAQPKENAEAGGKQEEAQALTESLLLETEEESPQPPKKEKRELEAEKALRTWTNRLANGEDNPKTEKPWTLEDVPSWLQSKVESDLKKLGGIEDKKEAGVSEDEQLDKLEFRMLMKTIPKLEPNKIKEVQEKFKYYQSRGMNNLHALQETLDVMSEKDEEFKRGLNRGLRAAPPEGEPVMKKKEDSVDEAFKKTGEQFGLKPKDVDNFKKFKKENPDYFKPSK